MITLTDPTTGTSVQLDPDRGWRWVDEYDWQPVVASATRSLAGKPIIQTATKVGGRPITLAAGPNDKAWLKGSEVAQLAAWARVPDMRLNLAMRGDLYRVIWRHMDQPALSVEPVIDYADPDANDDFMATLKLMEI